MPSKIASPSLAEELSSVAGLIDDLIANDSYPVPVRPLLLRKAVSRYPCLGGKRIRPALLLWSCGALGGNVERATSVAAAVEVYHNWSLVHDDIIDQDDFRRGEPTTHHAVAAEARKAFGLDNARAVKYGTDLAILAGDLQRGWASSLILGSVDAGVPPAVALFLGRELCGNIDRGLISGEALDVELAHRSIEDIRPREVERMIALKTGVLLRFCAEAGARLALGHCRQDASVQRLGDFAAAAGAAFQLKDDWLGVFGDTEVTGKPVGSDIRAAKPTLLILSALGKLTGKRRRELLDCLGSDTPSALRTARKAIRDSGAENAILAKAARLVDKAKTTLRPLPPGKHKQLLLALADAFVNRDK